MCGTAKLEGSPSAQVLVFKGPSHKMKFSNKIDQSTILNILIYNKKILQEDAAKILLRKGQWWPMKAQKRKKAIV